VRLLAVRSRLGRTITRITVTGRTLLWAPLPQRLERLRLGTCLLVTNRSVKSLTRVLSEALRGVAGGQRRVARYTSPMRRFANYPDQRFTLRNGILVIRQHPGTKA